MPIQCQSDSNPGPIRCQSRAIPWPNPESSDPFFANSSQSNTNPVPIWCQSKVNFSMNLCQSLPILANPMPISGQSVTSYVINHRTSPLYGMVPSLIGGWIKANSPVIDWQVISTGPNPFQSMPILINPLPIPGQSVSTHANPCAKRRSIFHKRKVCQLSNLSQS